MELNEFNGLISKRPLKCRKNPWPSMKKNTQRKISSDDSWNCSTSASWNLTVSHLKLGPFAPKRMAEKSSKHPFFRVHFLLFLDPQGIERKIPHRIWTLEAPRNGTEQQDAFKLYAGQSFKPPGFGGASRAAKGKPYAGDWGMPYDT